VQPLKAAINRKSDSDPWPVLHCLKIRRYPLVNSISVCLFLISIQILRFTVT
jgi:hypothetical protein